MQSLSSDLLGWACHSYIPGILAFDIAHNTEYLTIDGTLPKGERSIHVAGRCGATPSFRRAALRLHSEVVRLGVGERMSWTHVRRSVPRLSCSWLRQRLQARHSALSTDIAAGLSMQGMMFAML